MQAGKLRQRWQFQQRTLEPDPWGGDPREGDFATVFEDFGELTPMVGGETVIANRLQGIQPAILRVRQNAKTRTANETWRLLDPAGRTWSIKAPPTDPTQKRALLEFLIQSPSLD